MRQTGVDGVMTAGAWPVSMYSICFITLGRDEPGQPGAVPPARRAAVAGHGGVPGPRGGAQSPRQCRVRVTLLQQYPVPNSSVRAHLFGMYHIGCVGWTHGHGVSLYTASTGTLTSARRLVWPRTWEPSVRPCAASTHSCVHWPSRPRRSDRADHVRAIHAGVLCCSHCVLDPDDVMHMAPGVRTPKPIWISQAAPRDFAKDQFACHVALNHIHTQPERRLPARPSCRSCSLSSRPL